ncbi:MAG: hypothetical protein NTW96_10945, partial [Planctomycetia bacterium]|nr:hypothetical protein [Planctomycetia bacterium]
MRWLIPGIACHLVLGCCLIWAQEPTATAPATAQTPGAPAVAGTPPVNPPAAPEAKRIQEVQPPVYYVEGNDGKLVPLLGFTFDDFVKVFNQMQGLLTEARPSRYVLEKLSAVGRIEADRAELTVQWDVVSREDGPVRVPLHFPQAVVQGDVRHEGEGETSLEFEEGGDGYVCWIRGKAGQRHQLTLKLLLPLEMVGDETRLSLRAPHATQSEMRLTVPLAGAVGRVSEGATLRTGVPADATHTEFITQGFRGNFEIAWHKAEVQIVRMPTVLEVVGEMLARIDDHGVNTEATLRVRGHGEPFDRFQVRLPAGAELQAASPSGYSVTEVAGGDAAEGAGRLVEVQLRQKTSGPVTVRLAARREHDKPPSASWLELAGFEVLGAARQSGHIGVEVAGDLYVSWDPKLGVRQVEQMPESLRGQDLVAGFEYFVQPCSLKARVTPRTTRVSVEPEYLLLVDAAQVQLEGTLRYTVRGKKALVLDVALGDWEFDEVGPENLAAVDGVEVTESGLLSIPLVQPSTGQIELKLKAHRRIPQQTKSLRLTFPQPKVTSPGPAAVVILPADNVQLTPDAQATVGLARQEVAAPMKLPKRQQTPLFYRGEVARAAFVADRAVHAQAIAVNVRSQVMLEGSSGGVQQRLSYQIDYEPQGKLTLAVPRSLVGLEGLAFQLDGQTLPATAITEAAEPKSGDSETVARIEIALPSARIGACELTVRYPLAPSNLVPKTAIVRRVPLVMPLDGRLSSSRLVVAGPPEFQLKPPGAPWKPQSEGTKADATAAAPRQSQLEMVAAEPAGAVELGVYLDARNTPGATVVQRAWVQTWLTQTAREDRALFRFTTDRKEIEVILPDEVAETEVSFYLDGQALPATAITEAAEPKSGDSETVARIEIA